MWNRKRLIALSVIAVLLVAVCGCLFFIKPEQESAPSNEDVIATMGGYELTENDLWDFLFMSCFYEDGVMTLEETAKTCVQFQIAEAEIAGTEYDLPAEQRENLAPKENANDKESSAEFCAQYGITQEELTRSTSTSKLEILIKGRHVQMVIEQLKEANPDTDYTVEEFRAYYENYMQDKVKGMKLEVLEEGRFAQLEAFRDTLKEKTK